MKRSNSDRHAEKSCPTTESGLTPNPYVQSSGVAWHLHRYEALAGHPSLGPAVARLLHQRLEALGGQKGVAAYGELLRHPLTVLTPDDARRYTAVAAWPLLHECHDSRRSVPTWEHLGPTLCRRVVPKMFP